MRQYEYAAMFFQALTMDGRTWVLERSSFQGFSDDALADIRATATPLLPPETTYHALYYIQVMNAVGRHGWKVYYRGLNGTTYEVQLIREVG